MRIADLLQPELSGLNRLAMRPSFDLYNSFDEARDRTAGTRSRPLDGPWKFLLVDHPEACPPEWMAPDFDTSDWMTLAVPGCWTRQGVDDRPHYTNVVMPWPELDPPAVPDRNPTGLYRREFRLTNAWRTRDVHVEFGGAESVLALWCNGEFVGMGKDSRLPSAFDLTPFLRAGPNVLAAMVIRWSDATWIEDQDHWWHAGLHRSVQLLSRSPVHLRDLQVTADFDPDTGTGHLHVRAEASEGVHGWKVRTTLMTDAGRRVGRQQTAPVQAFGTDGQFEQHLSAYAFEGVIAATSVEVPRVKPWSAEAPNRYRVVAELLDEHGTVIEVAHTWTGFRRVEVRDRRLLVNGVAIQINGVNRHDHHPVTGKTLTVGEIRSELLTMKRHNVNAVRTSHYPNDPMLYDLCTTEAVNDKPESPYPLQLKLAGVCALCSKSIKVYVDSGALN